MGLHASLYVLKQNSIIYSVHYRNKDALTSVNDVNPYISIINLLDSIFNLLPVVIR